MIAAALLTAMTAQTVPIADIDAFRRQQTTFRTQRVNRLKAPQGWLSVAGLPWLRPGANSVGARETDRVRFRDGATPDRVGTLELAGDKVTLRLAPGVQATRNGQPLAAETVLSLDESTADRIQIGRVTFNVIRRGERIGVRIWDPETPGRVKFQGLKWFPADPKLVLRAKFHPYNPPKSIEITNILGDRETVRAPGYITFELGGKTHRLDAQGSLQSLFLNFQDETSRKETYPAGRFLYTGPVTDGEVVVDFNQAVNPPCAYTAFATCPLPPAGNRVAFPIRAGERTHHAIID